MNTKPSVSKLCVAAMACSLYCGSLQAQSLNATISVDLANAGIPANAALLGSNTQWVDNGDGLVSDTGQARTATVNGAVQTQPTVLRYPGGSLSDTYRWRDGVGPIETRGSDRTLDNRYQSVHFGTDEFLQLAARLNAAPVITVNVATATAQEAADWVRYTNLGGSPVGQSVKYWEIGNEPYLQESARPDLAMAPAEYASRANAAILAMKAVDPSIKVGIPLRSDTIGGVAATPYPGFNNTVLAQITAPFDCVAVHDGYFPFVFTSDSITDQDLFGAAMAASGVLAADLDATRAQLRLLRPGQNIPIALTEYNALFGVVSQRLLEYSNSLAGALYVADTLNMLASRTDVIAANIWSLSGNGSFGVVDDAGRPRPTSYVMQGFRRLLQGRLLPATVTAPLVGSAAVGAVPAANTVAISAGVTRNNNMLRLVVVNKHSTLPVSLTLQLANGSAAAGGFYVVLGGGDLFAGAPNHTSISLATGMLSTGGNSLALALPAHSVTLYEIPLN